MQTSNQSGIQKLAIALHHHLQTLACSKDCFAICLRFTSAAKAYLHMPQKCDLCQAKGENAFFGTFDRLFIH